VALGCSVQGEKFSGEQLRAKELIVFRAVILFWLPLSVTYFPLSSHVIDPLLVLSNLLMDQLL